MSLSRPPISWITTGGTLKIRSGCRMFHVDHRLFHTNRRVTIFLRPLKVSCTRSTSHLLLQVLSRLRCVVFERVPIFLRAEMAFSSTPASHSRLFVLVYFAHAGTSPAYAQCSSLVSQANTRAGLRSSSQDIQPSCAPLVG